MFSPRFSLAGMGVLLRLFKKFGYFAAATARGITRLGPRRSSLLTVQIWLSPPGIRCLHLDCPAPGLPAPDYGSFVAQVRDASMRIEEISVLVPPTSTTAQVLSPERWEAPTRLAAGPEKNSFNGFFRASLIPTTEPSHLSIRSRTLIPRFVISKIMDFTNCLVIGMSWALRKAVTALS